MYACLLKGVCVCACNGVSVCVFDCLSKGIYMCVCVCVCTCLRKCVLVLVYMHMCICVCLCKGFCVYIWQVVNVHLRYNSDLWIREQTSIWSADIVVVMCFFLNVNKKSHTAKGCVIEIHLIIIIQHGFLFNVLNFVNANKVSACQSLNVMFWLTENGTSLSI